MLKGFKQFILRGNVIDLAVGVVIGAAFNSVVQALVKDFINPLISAIAKTPDFSKYTFMFRGATFAYGDFINALISFLLTAAAVYYFVVTPINTLVRRIKDNKEEHPDPTTKKCPECMSEIPIQATRCAHCTVELPKSTPEENTKTA